MSSIIATKEADRNHVFIYKFTMLNKLQHIKFFNKFDHRSEGNISAEYQTIDESYYAENSIQVNLHNKDVDIITNVSNIIYYIII